MCVCLGEAGNAARMMLILNMVQGSFMATIAEGLTLAQATGQSQQTFLDILCQGQMASTFVDQKCQSEQALLSSSSSRDISGAVFKDELRSVWLFFYYYYYFKFLSPKVYLVFIHLTRCSSVRSGPSSWDVSKDFREIGFDPAGAKWSVWMLSPQRSCNHPYRDLKRFTAPRCRRATRGRCVTGNEVVNLLSTAHPEGFYSFSV